LVLTNVGGFLVGKYRGPAMNPRLRHRQARGNAQKHIFSPIVRNQLYAEW
jgi:hypothetical protein